MVAYSKRIKLLIASCSTQCSYRAFTAVPVEMFKPTLKDALVISKRQLLGFFTSTKCRASAINIGKQFTLPIQHFLFPKVDYTSFQTISCSNPVLKAPLSVHNAVHNSA